MAHVLAVPAWVRDCEDGVIGDVEAFIADMECYQDLEAIWQYNCETAARHDEARIKHIIEGQN